MAPKFDINVVTKYFFLAGSILFGISAAGSTYSLHLLWAVYNFGQKISSISSILFNIVLVCFFLFMYKGAAKTVKDVKLIEKDILEIAKEHELHRT
jgi:RsiW-degrading membrane proteinase PrsW (M82 family)